MYAIRHKETKDWVGTSSNHKFYFFIKNGGMFYEAKISMEFLLLDIEKNLIDADEEVKKAAKSKQLEIVSLKG